jgi:hypothetical protein
MDLTTLAIDLVIFLVVVAVLVSFGRALRARPARGRMVALRSAARARYVESWDRIEKRFMDEPEEAVTEADSLTLGMLGERGHPLGTDRLPNRLRSARRKLSEGRKRHRTEELRLALLDYRAVFTQMIGPEVREPVAEGRRETA